MKNTIKISIMSGLVTAGVLLCGVHIANAQTNIDTGYTITIPSEVGIDKDSGKGSFSVSGKIDAQTELDVTTTWYIVIDPSNWSSTIYSSFLSTCL